MATKQSTASAAVMSRARFSHVRLSPRKEQGLADLVRGRRVEDAIGLLQFCPKRGAGQVLKLLRSAVANADQRGGVDVDRLYVHAIRINSGPHMKRSRPRSRGMAHPILKRTSHFDIELMEKVKG